MDLFLIDYLKKKEISYTLYEHQPVFTVEQHKKANLNLKGLHTKNLFLKDEKNNFYLVVMPGEKRLDIKFLKKYLNVKDLYFGSPEELKSQLNVLPGSVSIFSMIYSNKVILILDNEVWLAPLVCFHPNVNTATLELTHKEFEKFLKSLDSKKILLELPE